MNVNFYTPVLNILVICAAMLCGAVSAFSQAGGARLAPVSTYDTVGASFSRPRIVEIKREAGGSPDVAAASPFSFEHNLYQLINVKRAELGLDRLNWNNDLARLARGHSDNMARHRFFSHAGLDGLMIDGRADAAGLTRWRAIGENIAYNRGFQNPVEVAVHRWLLSQSHKENLLDRRWKETGIGVALSPNGTYYFTQVFMLRK